MNIKDLTRRCDVADGLGEIITKLIHNLDEGNIQDALREVFHMLNAAEDDRLPISLYAREEIKQVMLVHLRSMEQALIDEVTVEFQEDREKLVQVNKLLEE